MSQTKTEVAPRIAERFQWATGFTPSILGDHVIRGVALNVGQTRNRHLYTRDELVQAARTLINKPLLINHWHAPSEIPAEVLARYPRLAGQGQYPPGIVFDSNFEDDRVEYIARIDSDEIWEAIKRGDIQYVSVDTGFRRVEPVNGLKPVGIAFEELSLILPPWKPGDPASSVEIVERLLETYSRVSDGCLMEMNVKEIQPSTSTAGSLQENATKSTIPANTRESPPTTTSETPAHEERPFLKALEEWLQRPVGEAEYPWDQCIEDMKAQGHDDESAARICAAIKRRTVQHLLTEGLARNVEEAVHVLGERSREPLVRYLTRVIYDQCNSLREMARTLGQRDEKIGVLSSRLQEAERKAAAYQVVEELVNEKVGKAFAAVKGLEERLEELNKAVTGTRSTPNLEESRGQQQKSIVQDGVSMTSTDIPERLRKTWEQRGREAERFSRRRT